MKLIHTSDWHVGQELRGYARLDEHSHFVDQLCRIAADERPDALLVCGDVYDTKIPTALTQRALVDSTLRLRRACPDMKIIVTAGNHDSGARLDAQSLLWEAIGVSMVGACRRSADDLFDPSELIIELPGKGLIIAAPYFHPRNFPVAAADTKTERRQRAFFAALGSAAEDIDAGRKLPVAMMAHLTVDGCDLTCHRQSSIGGIKAEAAESMGAGFDYLALGHIHKPQTLRTGAGTIRYSGSPYAMSFSEDFPHSVSVVEIASRHAEPLVREVAISPLRQAITIQPQDGDFGTAVEMARRLDRDDESYVRFVVKNNGALPPEPMQEAAAMLEGYRLRLCSIEIAHADRAAMDGADDAAQGFDINEFKALSPVELVEKINSASPLQGLPDDWREMLDEAYQLTLKDQALQ